MWPANVWLCVFVYSAHGHHSVPFCAPLHLLPLSTYRLYSPAACHYINIHARGFLHGLLRSCLTCFVGSPLFHLRVSGLATRSCLHLSLRMWTNVRTVRVRVCSFCSCLSLRVLHSCTPHLFWPRFLSLHRVFTCTAGFSRFLPMGPPRDAYTYAHVRFTHTTPFWVWFVCMDFLCVCADAGFVLGSPASPRCTAYRFLALSPASPLVSLPPYLHVAADYRSRSLTAVYAHLRSHSLKFSFLSCAHSISFVSGSSINAKTGSVHVRTIFSAFCHLSTFVCSVSISPLCTPHVWICGFRGFCTALLHVLSPPHLALFTLSPASLVRSPLVVAGSTCLTSAVHGSVISFLSRIN